MLARVPPDPPVPASDPERLFRDYLPHIEKVIAAVCRRNHCSGDEAEDFASVAKLKLVDDDYAVIRKYKGESSFSTYLTVVVSHAFQDWRNHLWGKWRPSAEAKRLGKVAVELERLLRDGMGLDQAIETLRTNHGIELSRKELEAIAAKLPPRTPRRPPEGEEVLEHQASPDPQPDEQLMLTEEQAAWSRVVAALERVRAALPEEDRLLLQMRFDEGLQVAEIARALCYEQKPLYRRFERICQELRNALAREGIPEESIRELLRSDPRAEGRRINPPGPSKGREGRRIE